MATIYNARLNAQSVPIDRIEKLSLMKQCLLQVDYLKYLLPNPTELRLHAVLGLRNWGGSLAQVRSFNAQP